MTSATTPKIISEARRFPASALLTFRCVATRHRSRHTRAPNIALIWRQVTKRSPNGPSNIETNRVKREIMDPNETIIEIAGDRRRLQSIRDAVLDAQDLCARAMSTVQASQELLQQADDLRRSNMGPLLRKK